MRLSSLMLPRHCLPLPLLQVAHDTVQLAALAALAGDHARKVTQDGVVIAVVAGLLHDPRETPLPEVAPFDVGFKGIG